MQTSAVEFSWVWIVLAQTNIFLVLAACHITTVFSLPPTFSESFCVTVLMRVLNKPAVKPKALHVLALTTENDAVMRVRMVLEVFLSQHEPHIYCPCWTKLYTGKDNWGHYFKKGETKMSIYYDQFVFIYCVSTDFVWCF